MTTLRGFCLAALVWLIAVPTLGEDAAVEVHLYPHLLVATDRLQDGPDLEAFPLDGHTFLIWVDLAPGFRYTHPTAYVLVSHDRVRVEPGGWWPVLNGRSILYGRANQAAMVSPLTIPGGAGDPIEIHFCPGELIAGDLLADGEQQIAEISTDTMLVWIDLLPTAFFTHPTRYVLITADGDIFVHDGGWWPTVNGKAVLFSSDGAWAVPSPFRLIGERYGGNSLSVRRSQGRVGH